MVIKSVNDQSPKSEYQSKEIQKDLPASASTREERLIKPENKCEKLGPYLTRSVFPHAGFIKQ